MLTGAHSGDVITFQGIFHEVFDWNNQKDSRSPESYKVSPGDVLHQSVRYVAENNSYDMYIASERLGKSISWNYQLEKKQTVPESTAFIVVEHAPPGLPNLSCNKFPASNNITFTNIVIEVAGKVVPVRPSTWMTHPLRFFCSLEDTDGVHRPP